jgi:uncharacterized heparinase superfamily protein
MSEHENDILERIAAGGLRRSTMVQALREGLSQLKINNPLANLQIAPVPLENLTIIPPDSWPGDVRHGTDILQGTLRLGGQVIQQREPHWQPVGATPGFLYALHSFDWLHDLRALGGDAARRQARLMVRSWIEHNTNQADESWEPLLLGERIGHWLGLYDFFCATADDDFRLLVLESLRRQARQLAKHISATPAGFARFTALKGLFYAGICLPKGEAKIALGLKHLLPELATQVLADGGQVQRRPDALVHTLRALIDIRNILRTGAQEVPEKLQHAIDRLTPALRFFRHADGALAVFGGGREGNATLIDAVLNHADARGRPLKSMPHVGFERLVSGRTCLVMDCGTPPEEPFTAGCTAGLLSFEMSVGRDRLIVNCGSHPSGLASWRKALSATAAHSTLTLNDTNALELQERGLGRSAQTVTCERMEENGALWVEASHDGYEHLFKTLHFRRLYLGHGGDDVRGEDTLEGPAGQSFAIRFHLHPNVQASLIQQGQAVLLALPSGGGWRLRCTGGSLSLEDSIYCGREDEPRRTQQIVIIGTTEADATTVKWALQREKRV